jgi:hypothetical protein
MGAHDLDAPALRRQSWCNGHVAEKAYLYIIMSP